MNIATIIVSSALSCDVFFPLVLNILTIEEGVLDFEVCQEGVQEM